MLQSSKKEGCGRCNRQSVCVARPNARVAVRCKAFVPAAQVVSKDERGKEQTVERPGPIGRQALLVNLQTNAGYGKNEHSCQVAELGYKPELLRALMASLPAMYAGKPCKGEVGYSQQTADSCGLSSAHGAHVPR